MGSKIVFTLHYFSTFIHNHLFSYLLCICLCMSSISNLHSIAHCKHLDWKIQKPRNIFIIFRKWYTSLEYAYSFQCREYSATYFDFLKDDTYSRLIWVYMLSLFSSIICPDRMYKSYSEFYEKKRKKEKKNRFKLISFLPMLFWLSHLPQLLIIIHFCLYLILYYCRSIDISHV